MLHLRAYEWHRDHGSVSEAIEHATEAGAFAEATELITTAWFRTLSQGRYVTILAWLARFPAELLRANASLLLVQAWVLSLCGRRDEAAAAIQALERLGWSDRKPPPDGSGSLEASLATIRAAFPGGDVGMGYANALRAVELQSPESPFWPAPCWPLGMCCYYRGDLDGADRWFRETAEGSPRSSECSPNRRKPSPENGVSRS
jgi:ATP/maltotriose-dependent transcriptional regulator MalT